MTKQLSELSELNETKNIERFSNKVQKGRFWACLGPFGPNEKFHCTLIQSAYYALTFSKEIRKKYGTVFK